MTRIDENQEVIALIRMTIDASKPIPSTSNQEVEHLDPDAIAIDADNPTSDPHWKLGSSMGVTSSKALENEMKGINPIYDNFHFHLTSFLEQHLPDEIIPEGFSIKVSVISLLNFYF
jgi:hypothetical protein